MFANLRNRGFIISDIISQKGAFRIKQTDNPITARKIDNSQALKKLTF